jgi:hypothetical protein
MWHINLDDSAWIRGLVCRDNFSVQFLDEERRGYSTIEHEQPAGEQHLQELLYGGDNPHSESSVGPGPRAYAPKPAPASSQAPGWACLQSGTRRLVLVGEVGFDLVGGVVVELPVGVVVPQRGSDVGVPGGGLGLLALRPRACLC